MKQPLAKRSVGVRLTEDSQRRKRILLGQLSANGDCLYATTIARRIKHDYPGCHLTWAISSMCRSILDGNPDVDEVWEIPQANRSEGVDAWKQFEREARERQKRGEFDEIFLTQISPGNLHNFDMTVRTSIFRAYPKPITVPITPLLRLFPAEVENVRRFAESHRLADRGHVILFECSPKSNQSFVTPDFALEVSRKLIAEIPDVCVILSSNIPIDSNDGHIIDGSVLSFRENAELTKYCSLLVGCSSGITWISTSDWAKPLPMIQLLKSSSFCFASVAYDYEYWGISTNTIIEMTDCSAERLLHCIMVVLTEGFDKARSVFHQSARPTFYAYRILQLAFLRQGRLWQSLRLLSCNIRRHGLQKQLILANLQVLIYGFRSILRKASKVRRLY